MTKNPPSGWRDLFSEGAGEISIILRTLKKRGDDFLVLPAGARDAARSLSLYPAQTRLARLARGMLRFALLCKLPLPLKSAVIRINADSPFEGFLKRLAGSENFPVIAILCGNPRTPGRRFVVLVFGNDGNPAFVVKAGIGHDAQELINREIAFLKAAPPGTSGIPRLRDELEVDGLRCLALDFVEGDSPSDLRPLADVLTAWLRKDSRVPLDSLPAWQKLALVCANHPVFARLVPRLSGKLVYTAIQHGDFAPWNIKLARAGSWVVLDWERGEFRGIPAWDWFHYVIQTGILIRHFTTGQLIVSVDDLLASPDFTDYARHAGIDDIATELLLAYLLYCVWILKPADSLEHTNLLLDALWDRLKNNLSSPAIK